jgi:hypothetical protein
MVSEVPSHETLLLGPVVRQNITGWEPGRRGEGGGGAKGKGGGGGRGTGREREREREREERPQGLDIQFKATPPTT